MILRGTATAVVPRGPDGFISIAPVASLSFNFNPHRKHRQMQVVTIIGSGRFPSYKQPGKTHEARLMSDGTGDCNCPGFVRYGHCRHIDSLKPVKQTRNRKAKR